jgi:hypothetical protein
MIGGVACRERGDEGTSRKRSARRFMCRELFITTAPICLSNREENLILDISLKAFTTRCIFGYVLLLRVIDY